MARRAFARRPIPAFLCGVSDVGPVIAAGGAFAFTVLLGIGIGVWLQHVTGNGLWVMGGLFVGLAVGAYSAVRLLFRSL